MVERSKEKIEKIKHGILEERWREGREINKDIGVKNANLYEKDINKKKGMQPPNAVRQTGVAVTVSFGTLLHCPDVP